MTQFKLDISENESVEFKTSFQEDVILQLIQQNPQITTNEIAKKISVTKRTVLRDIEKLKQKKILLYRGSAKDGYWEVQEEDET